MTWAMKPISELCELAIDCVNKTAPVVEGPTPYKMIRTTNVKGGFIDIEHVRYVTEETFEKWTRRSRPKYGDVVLTREAPVGEVGRCTFDESQNIFLGQRLFLYRPDSKLLDWNYLAYALQSPIVQNKLHGMSFGATVPHVKVGDAENLEIPYPELGVQKSIGTTLAAYDDLIENNRSRISLLEELARLRYRHLFSSIKIDSLPAGWKCTKLSTICDQIREPADPANLHADTPYLSMEHMTPKSITLGKWEYAGKVNSSKLIFRRNEVLFGRIRPYFHKVGVAFIDGITSTDMIVVRPKSKLLLPIVALTMSSDEFVAHAVMTSNGTKMPRADWKVLKDWEILLPSKLELEAFAEELLPVFESLECLSKQNNALVIAREQLLPKMISGEIHI